MGIFRRWREKKNTINSAETIVTQTAKKEVAIVQNTQHNTLKKTKFSPSEEKITQKEEKKSQYLGFSSCKDEWLIPIEHIARISFSTNEDILPQNNPYIIGVISTEEGVVPVLDAVALLTKRDVCFLDKAKSTVIICVYEGQYIGLLVEKTTRMYIPEKEALKGEENTIHCVENTKNTNEYPLVLEVLLQNEKILPVIDIPAIFKKYHEFV